MDFPTAFVHHSAKLLEREFYPRIALALEPLTDDQIWWRPNPSSNSIGNLVLHLQGNIRQWIVSGLGGEPDIRKRDEEFTRRGGADRSDLLSGLRSTIINAAGVIRALTPDALMARYVIQGNDVSGLEAVYHVVEHCSMHTGQILMLTKMQTNTDLKLYEFPGGKAVPKW